MKLVHLYASLGALLVAGSLPYCQADAECGRHMTCGSLQSCTAKHKANLGILFPCKGKGSNNFCCPAVEDPAVLAAKKAKAIASSMKLFDFENCGRETSERIKNGYEAKSGEFPWMALLGYTDKDKKVEYLCGGTLITKQFVLTAAHCLTVRNYTLSEVRLGELDKRTDPDCLSALVTGTVEICAEKVVTRLVTRTLSHEKYSLRELKNDIGLVWLNRPVENSDTIRPICLPFNMTEIGQDIKLRVSGWGKLDHDNDLGSPVLQWTYVNTSSNEDCNGLIAPGNREITPEQICASGYSGEDACKGDSGGPLMYLDPDISAAIQVGIVSYGLRRCGQLNSPTVYTRVSQYVDWILVSMQKKVPPSS